MSDENGTPTHSAATRATAAPFPPAGWVASRGAGRLRVTRRMATWWQCAIVIAVAAFFGWVIREGLLRGSPGVWRHVLIPPYGVLLYVTVANLVNRRSVVVTPGQLVMTNGPIVLGDERRRIRRDEVAFCFWHSIVTVGDSGDSVVLWHTAGVQTKAGRGVAVFDTIADAEAARAAAQSIADAFGTADGRAPIEVRPVGTVADDPAEQRRGWIWVGIVVAAFAAGFAWELAHRWHG